METGEVPLGLQGLLLDLPLPEARAVIILAVPVGVSELLLLDHAAQAFLEAGVAAAMLLALPVKPLATEEQEMNGIVRMALVEVVGQVILTVPVVPMLVCMAAGLAIEKRAHLRIRFELFPAPTAS